MEEYILLTVYLALMALMIIHTITPLYRHAAFYRLTRSGLERDPSFYLGHFPNP
jgi:hypothetical protein